MLEILALLFTALLGALFVFLMCLFVWSLEKIFWFLVDCRRWIRKTSFSYDFLITVNRFDLFFDKFIPSLFLLFLSGLFQFSYIVLFCYCGAIVADFEYFVFILYCCFLLCLSSVFFISFNFLKNVNGLFLTSLSLLSSFLIAPILWHARGEAASELNVFLGVSSSALIASVNFYSVVIGVLFLFLGFWFVFSIFVILFEILFLIRVFLLPSEKVGWRKIIKSLVMDRLMWCFFSSVVWVYTIPFLFQYDFLKMSSLDFALRFDAQKSIVCGDKIISNDVKRYFPVDGDSNRYISVDYVDLVFSFNYFKRGYKRWRNEVDSEMKKEYQSMVIPFGGQELLNCQKP
ncbi:hypothetical protein KIK84_01565 [Curvibacter sp. CHRR-16]|uniref:hypothetical protein n=1 Tax=Curvibacter sp. CHRR-16 TaxID=2835872 RepID=UPI001BD918B7|nr:hypothetical protein [Curvibacter sp. CHRR-16]MBT0569003.1 hypothetical protein [Curvibacter sp. CHRR-16]